MTSATSETRTGAPLRGGDDQRTVLVAGQELVVCPNRVGLATAIETALGLIDVGLGHGSAQVFQRQPIRRERRRVGLNAHRRLLAAADADLPHARQLRDLLGQTRIGQVLHFRQRQRLRGHGKVRMGASAGLILL